MSVRAKFKVRSHEASLNYDNKPITTINLTPVSGGNEENKGFFASTPFGEIKLGSTNAEVARQLPLGAEVYVDFTPVDG